MTDDGPEEPDVPLDLVGTPAGDGASSADGADASPPVDGGEGHDGAVADGDQPGPAALLDDVEPEEDADGVQPVELLVQLAEDGEIDPWDIDIVSVTDKFLARLDDSDLRTSGRALFYASVLLRMKGDDLLQEEPDEEEEPEPAPWEAPAMPDHDPVEDLEAEMERRLDRKRVRGSPETLEDLVHELRDAERRMWWKEARTYDTAESPHGFRRGTQTLDYHADDGGRMGGEPTEADVTGTTHDEDIEAVIDDVRAALRERYEKGREEVLYAEVERAGGTRVMTYLALLFLAHRGEVHLRQDDLFGDLWVRDLATASGTGEALAD